MKFKTEPLKAWKDIRKYSKHGWLYRGHREADWELKSSFERCCQRHNIEPGKRRELERRLFREFRRTYTLYAKHTPLSNSIIEWLSLMQHYGAPTRLLDFTYSIYVAAYFATEEADGESAVWALDAKWVRQRAHSLLGAAGKSGPFFDSMPKGEPFEQRDEEQASKLFLEAPYARACWPINGFNLNERLIIQRGAFLVCGDIRHSFMDNIIPLMEPGADAHVLKIVIPRKVGRQAIKELWLCGTIRG